MLAIHYLSWWDSYATVIEQTLDAGDRPLRAKLQARAINTHSHGGLYFIGARQFAQGCWARLRGLAPRVFLAGGTLGSLHSPIRVGLIVPRARLPPGSCRPGLPCLCALGAYPGASASNPPPAAQSVCFLVRGYRRALNYNKISALAHRKRRSGANGAFHLHFLRPQISSGQP